MTEEGFESSNKEFEKRMKYERLTLMFSDFIDISSMGAHLYLCRSKIGTTEPKGLEIPDEIRRVGIEAMRKEFLKEIEEAKKGTNYERK
mgnify:CR=1 FL=1|nr:hypothetical protein [uncultured Prevotella sp.]